GRIGTPAAAWLADGEDREHPAVGILERHEQLVLGMPRIRFVRWLDLRYVARADVLGPVERAVRYQVRAATLEFLGQQVPPRAPLVRAAEQRVARVLAAINVRDAEVVELRPVEVEHDRLELERLGDRLHDRRERALQLPLAADGARHLEQRLHARAAEGLLQLFLTPRTRSPHAQLLE